MDEFDYLLKEVGVVVLSHGRNDKLEKSLQSYEKNGLTDMVGDNFIFFNEISNNDVNLVNSYQKYDYGGHQQNLGIGWGMVKAIAESYKDYVLFLENDFELDATQEDIYKQLTLGLNAIHNDFVDIVVIQKIGGLVLQWKKILVTTIQTYVKNWIVTVMKFCGRWVQNTLIGQTILFYVRENGFYK